GHDWMFTMVKRYVRWAVLNPGRMLRISTPVLVGLTLIAFSPRPPIVFDVSTHSMEPKRSDAGFALKTIMEKMPTRWEPVIGIIQAKDPQQLHDYWQKIAAHWAEVQAAGKIKGFSTPAALALSPANLQTNRQRLQGANLSSARDTLEAAIAAEGFSRETFDSAFSLLERLQGVASASGQ